MNTNGHPFEATGRIGDAIGSPVARRHIGLAGLSLVAFALLAAASWGFILAGDNSGFADLFSAETWRKAGDFIGQLAGKGSGRTAYLQPGEWAHAAKLASETLAMSVLAISFAGIAVLATFLPAARNVAMGDLAPRHPGALVASKTLYLVLRAIFILTRAVPELIWAMVIIFFLSPGILPGALALGLHNYGILGKLSAEVVEGLDVRPARAVRRSGAGSFQMLAYAIMPQVLPQLTTYLLYRWEVVIRTTIVVGFVSAGGLGRDFRLSMSFFHYTDVALLLIWYILLVIGVDLLSARLRGLLRR